MWTTALQEERVEAAACAGVSGAGSVAPAAMRFFDPGVPPFGGDRVDARHAGGGGDEHEQGDAGDGPALAGDVCRAPAACARPPPEAADGAVADRLLDEPPGERRDREDRRHLEQLTQRFGAVGDPARGGEDDDREVPEVDRRRSARRSSAAASSRGSTPSRQAGWARAASDQHRREREHDEAAAVEERGVLAGPPDHQRDHQQAGDAERVERVAGAGGDPATQFAARPDHRQGGAEEQLEGAGVGAVVDPRGVEARAVEDRHQDRRDQRQQPGSRRPAAAARPEGSGASRTSLTPTQQDERPEDVELLLDRQRPEVVERAGRRRSGRSRRRRRRSAASC